MKAFLLVSMMFLGAQAMAADCFMNSAVNGFESLDHDSVIVTSLNKRYQVDTFICTELRWADAIAFRSWSGSSRICSGDDLYVVDQFNGRIIQQCRIDKVTKLDQ